MHTASAIDIIPPTAPGEPPTRRRVLSAFTGAAFAGTALVIAIPDAPAAEHPDAELIQVAAEFEALEHEIYPEHGPETMEAEEAWEAAVEPLHAASWRCGTGSASCGRPRLRGTEPAPT